MTHRSSEETSISLAPQGLAYSTPVIFGGANPDDDDDSEREDLGQGVILWDFVANQAFLAANPELGASPTQGRFAAGYHRGIEDDGEVVTIVLSSFRGFVAAEEPDAPPADMDYLYGHVEAASATYDFIDLHVLGEVHTPEGSSSSELEQLDMRLAFIDRGVGRAEVLVSGSDIQNETYDALEFVECWDDAVAQTYLRTTPLTDNGDRLTASVDGEVSGCVAPFSRSLDELDIPDLDDLDDDIRDALADLAANGLPAQETPQRD